jgi:hypothetical protein
MNFRGNNIRQLWLPFLILAVVILAVTWIVAGVIYPRNTQGNEPLPTTTNQVTSTAAFTVTPTRQTDPTSTMTSGVTTPSSTAIYNCTYTIHFWQSNPDIWMIENIVIGDLSFTKADAIAILEVVDPDPATGLIQQFFAALLNSLKGADSSTINRTMELASDWLTRHPPGVNLNQAERQEAESLAAELEAYNTGEIGPGHCADEPFTPTPIATLTPTITITPTRRPISTGAPSAASPTPTKDKDNGDKPKPTKPPATQPPPQPTDPPPQPTDPPPQPTDPPPEPTKEPPTPAPTAEP